MIKNKLILQTNLNQVSYKTLNFKNILLNLG